MSMDQLTIPTLKLEGRKFIVRWDEGVKIEVWKIYPHRNGHLTATVKISDSAELNGPHMLGPVRPDITKTWSSVIRELETISARTDWLQRLQQVTSMIVEAYEAGDPAMALDEMPQPEDTHEAVDGFMWHGVPTLLYGAGGIGKSIVGLNVLHALHHGKEFAGRSANQSNAMWLDWETTRNLAWWRNAEILKGDDLAPGRWPDPERPDEFDSPRGNMVFYKPMVGALIDNVETVADEIERFNIGTLMVDSAIPACGGEAESPKAAEEFFMALRAVKPRDRDIATLIISHITKEAARDNGQSSSPFGSTVWRDRARDTYELKASARKTAGHIDFAVHHRKSNMSAIRKPFGLRLTWDGARVEPLDIQDNNELVGTLTIEEQVEIELNKAGSMTLDELAEEIGAAKGSISSILSRSDMFESVDGRWAPSGVNF